MEIKVLGGGCARCKSLEEITRQALNELGLHAAIEKVQDYQEIAGYGVMQTPGLVVNGKVVLSGRIPVLEELKDLLQNCT